MAQSFNASLNVSLNTASLNASTKQVKQALGRITGQASEFQKSLDASTARVFAFGATTAVLNGVTQSFKKLISTTIEVEKRLIEVNSIFQATEASFSKFRNAIFQVAKDTGQSFSTVADGAAELARQGLSAEETASRLKSALVLTRISGLDAEKSVKALTAAINGFESAGLKHTEIVNKMVAVDTAFAVSAQDLAEAFSRAGSTAEDAGVSFDQLLGLVTAVEQKTARGGAVIGNAFKSIFTRLARGTTIEELKALGVQIDATQTGVQKLSALSTAIEGISDPTVVSKIKELAGGVFQINVVSAALKDLSSETGIFKEAAETAAFATNEAFEKNKALGESLADNINKLVVGLTSLAEKVGSVTFGPILENIVSIATKFTEFLDNALDPEKGNTFIKGFFKAIGTFLSGPAIVLFTVAFVKITKLIARFAGDGLKSLFQMGSQTERIQQIEGGIVGLLQRDATLRKQMESTTMSQAQKEQAVIAAIQRENALLTTQAQLMRNLASAAAARGVRGFSDSRGFTGKRGRRFNAGFRAEEAEAMMLGASPSVKAHMGRGTIGGQKFIMNNQEMEIPNFAGGRDSAVIPRYPKGFVPNYSRRNLQSIINNKSGRKTPEEIADARAQLAAMDARAAQKIPPISVSPAPYGFLVPTLGAGAAAKSIKKGSSKVSGNRFPYELTSTIKPFAPMMSGESIDKAAEPYDSKLEQRIKESVVKSATKYANLLVIPKGKNNKANSSDINRRLSQGGQRGAHGAIRGAVGAAFEAAVFSALGLDEFKAAKGGADWDVRQLNKVGKGEVRQIFRSPASISFADMKVGATQDTVDSFVGKILRHNKVYADDMARHREANKKKKAKGKARGFIPNFTKRGGVPTSLMRVHKDDKGEPVAVTNLRDEPNGLQDAIKRERDGVGMFAGGFVPNYNRGAAILGVFKSLQKTVVNFGSKAKTSAKGLGSMENKMGKATTGFFLLSSASGMVTASMEQQHAAMQAQLDQDTENLLTQAQLLDKDKEGLKFKDTEVGSIQRSVTARADEIMAMQRHTQSLMEERTILQKTASVLDKFAGVAATFALIGTFGGRGGKGGGVKGGKVPTVATGAATGASSGPFGVRPAPSAVSPKAGFLSKTGNFLKSPKGMGLIGTALTVGGAGFSLNSNSKRQDIGEGEKGRNTGKIIGGAGGALAGGVAGAKGGAALGALVGSAVPILGTAIGAALGGIIGGGVGAFFGQKGGAAAGEAVTGGKMTDEEKAADLSPIQKAFQTSDNVLPKILEEKGFGTGKEALAKFDERIFEMGNATPEFVQSIVEARSKIDQFAMEVSAAEKFHEEEEGDEGSLEKLNIARSKLATAQTKLALTVEKGAKLGNRTLGEAKDRENKIEAANKKLAAAQEKLAASHAKVIASNKKMIAAAEKNLQNAQLGSMMAAITPTGKGTGDEFGFNQQTNVLRASQEETMASIQADRAAVSAAQNELGMKGKGVLSNSDFSPEEVKDVAKGLREGKDFSGGDEKQQKLVKDAQAFNAATQDAAIALDKASNNFELNVKKAYIGFQKTINDIEAQQRKNAEARAALLQSSIQAASDKIATVFGGEALDMDFMGQQVSEIVNEINKGAGMDPEKLGQLMSEFDDQGLGVKIGDLIQQFDPSIGAEKLAKVLQTTLEAGIGASAKSAEGKRLVGVMGNEVKGGTKGFYKDAGVDVSDGMKRLDDESKSLADRLKIANANLDGLFTGDDTRNLAFEMNEMYQKMQNASSGLDSFANMANTQAEETKAVADLIDDNTKVLKDAEKTVKIAAQIIKDNKEELERLKG